MIAGLWGKKVGMTQLFVEDSVVPVTVVDVGRWVITQIKTEKCDGYNAIQVGLIKKRYAQESFVAGWLKKPKVYFAALREIRQKDAVSEETKVGQSVDCSSVVARGDKVDLFGVTIGRGFAGVVKRYNFGGPPGSHGSTMGKKPGSIGSFCSQGRVIKGKKMPGQMGNRNRVAKNLEVVRLEKESDVVLVKGSIPGKSGSLVFLRKEN